jgi:hypothetical protein
MLSLMRKMPFRIHTLCRRAPGAPEAGSAPPLPSTQWPRISAARNGNGSMNHATWVAWSKAFLAEARMFLW